MKIKVATIFGTRPEIIRLSLIIKKIDKYFDHILINTMQNYDESLNKKIFEELDIRSPDYYLTKNNFTSTGDIIGKIISETYTILENEKPDCILILGDTNSGFSAISSKKLQIPIFHMEAGNRSFDINLPEEINRRIIDEISDINLPYSERARNNLIAEGKNSNNIFKTGSPLVEVINHYLPKINNSNILNELFIKKEKYILVSIHRHENLLDSKIKNLLNSVKKVGEFLSKKIIFSLHPTTKNKLEKLKINLPKEFIICEPFGFFDYCKLQINSFCVISDSGSLAEESYIMNFAAVSIRNSTERQEAIEQSNFILGNLDYDNLVNSIEISKQLSSRIFCPDYDEKDVSSKIIRIIQSYTKIIKSQYEE